MKDLKGQRFGKLVVTEATDQRKNGYIVWRCRCDCGKETVVGQTLLQSGKTKSCGCLQKQIYAENLQLIDGTSVTVLESSRNRIIATNTSGHTGVYRHGKTGKWVAKITFRRKTYHLGSYDKIEDAIKAREKGEEMWDDFLDWYYSTYPEKKPKHKTD